jgi:hypothetical protein
VPVRRELTTAAARCGLVTAATAAWCGLLTPPAQAEDLTRTGVGADPPTELCVVDDRRAVELSGLIATATGYLAVNDSQPRARDLAVLELDASCAVVGTRAYPTPARDPEDLAVGPDGTLWVADTGDNFDSPNRRRTVALWRVPADGPLVIHRLAYPDGPHDAEALLVPDDGVPLIITKEPTGVAALYRPAAPLQARTADGVPLRKVGEFTPHATGENNFLGTLGEVMVTGAAISPDRRRVVLRTYTAAYEWDVPDGDVVKAVTGATPRVTALPDEPQGEAIAYTADGTGFVTVSDQPGPAALLRHSPSVAQLNTAPPAAAPDPTADGGGGGDGIPVWITLVAALAGLVLVAAGVLGLRQGRRQRNLPAPL